MKDFFGTKQRYCALCDYWYAKGTFKVHKVSELHQICLRDAKKMTAWYETNARLATK